MKDEIFKIEDFCVMCVEVADFFKENRADLELLFDILSDNVKEPDIDEYDFFRLLGVLIRINSYKTTFYNKFWYDTYEAVKFLDVAKNFSFIEKEHNCNNKTHEHCNSTCGNDLDDLSNFMKFYRGL